MKSKAKATQKAMNQSVRAQHRKGQDNRYGLFLTTIQYLGMVDQAMRQGNMDAAVKLSKGAIGNECVERTYNQPNVHVNVSNVIHLCDKCLEDIKAGLVQFDEEGYIPEGAMPVGSTDLSAVDDAVGKAL